MNTLFELLIKFIVRALRRHGRNFSHGLLTLVAIFGIGCVSGSGGDSTTEGSPISSPGGTALTVSRKSGFDFSCVSFTHSGGGRIWCRTEGSPDARLGLSSAQYSLYVASASPLTHFETWDDTVCFSLSVAQRPYSRNAGPATYCMGDASLGFNYVGYQYVVYGGPNFSSALHGSSDLSYAELPFVGGEGSFTMDVLTNTGGNFLVMTDSSVSVSAETLSCSLESDGTTVTCPDFTLTGVM